MTSRWAFSTYQLYQCLLPSQGHSFEGLWEMNNGVTYQYRADISASSALCAISCVLGQKIGKDKGEASIVGKGRSRPGRIASPGDVLVGSEDAWMITTAGEGRKISYSWPRPVATYDVSDEMYEVSWSPDGEWLAGAGRRKVFLRYHKSEYTHYYEYHRHPVNSLCWDPQGKRIVSGDSNGDVHFWSAALAPSPSFDASHGRILIVRPEIHNATKDAMRIVRWSLTKNIVAVGRACGTVFLLDPDTGEECFTYQGHDQAINTLAWSPDGGYIASGSDDKTVQVWSVKEDATPEVIYQEHQEVVRALAWSPHGRFVASAGANAQTVQVWNPHTGMGVTQIPLSVSYARTKPCGISLSWSPDGTYLAVGCADGTIQILDVASSSHIWTYRTSRNQRVATVSWSPDGMSIASGGDDLRISLWAWDYSCVHVQSHPLEQRVALFLE